MSETVVANLIGGPCDGEKREVVAGEPLLVERLVYGPDGPALEHGEYRPIRPLVPGASVVKVHGWTFRGWYEGGAS